MATAYDEKNHPNSVLNRTIARDPSTPVFVLTAADIFALLDVNNWISRAFALNDMHRLGISRVKIASEKIDDAIRTRDQFCAWQGANYETVHVPGGRKDGDGDGGEDAGGRDAADDGCVQRTEDETAGAVGGGDDSADAAGGDRPQGE